jgi:carbon storage regulator
MLVVSRRIGEAIILDDNTVIRVLGSRGKQVRLGVIGPARVHREEVLRYGEDGTAQQHDTEIRDA